MTNTEIRSLPDGSLTRGEVGELLDRLERLEHFAQVVMKSVNESAGTRAMAHYALTGSLTGIVDEMEKDVI